MSILAHASCVFSGKSLLSLFRLFFGCGPFLKSLWNLLQYGFFLVFLSLRSPGIWDLSFLTRDQTLTPGPGRWILYHRTTREVPSLSLSELCSLLSDGLIPPSGLLGKVAHSFIHPFTMPLNQQMLTGHLLCVVWFEDAPVIETFVHTH